jgi:glucan 1,3-beta-glucosidase
MEASYLISYILYVCSIPVGYWSVPLTSADTKYTTDPSPYIPGAWPYLVQAVDWAQKHDLHVIVDIHGAPGSQNGYDNSGQRTTKPLWALNSENVARTVDVLRYIVKELGDGVAVIQLLNEAGGWAGDEFKKAIRQYWLDGYDVVRQGGGGKAKVMIGDAFLGIDVRSFEVSRHFGLTRPL